MSAQQLPRVFPLLVVFGAVLVSVACDATDTTPCYPADYRACPCDNGVRGLQECSATGDGYGACDCSGNPPGTMTDASTASDSGNGNADARSADAGDAAAGGGAFGTACGSPADCASNTCFVGGMNSYCSIRCTEATVATDCPSPLTSGTCNMMGYCKK